VLKLRSIPKKGEDRKGDEGEKKGPAELVICDMHVETVAPRSVVAEEEDAVGDGREGVDKDVQRRNDQSAEGRRGFATISAQGGKRSMTD
jgi:hypothetical protein